MIYKDARRFISAIGKQKRQTLQSVYKIVQDNGQYRETDSFRGLGGLVHGAYSSTIIDP